MAGSDIGVWDKNGTQQSMGHCPMDCKANQVWSMTHNTVFEDISTISFQTNLNCILHKHFISGDSPDISSNKWIQPFNKYPIQQVPYV